MRAFVIIFLQRKHEIRVRTNLEKTLLYVWLSWKCKHLPRKLLWKELFIAVIRRLTPRFSNRCADMCALIWSVLIQSFDFSLFIICSKLSFLATLYLYWNYFYHVICKPYETCAGKSLKIACIPLNSPWILQVCTNQKHSTMFMFRAYYQIKYVEVKVQN